MGVGGALVAALCGFGIYQDNQRPCVGRNTQVILDESECRTGSGGAGSGHGVWYYGGRGGSVGEKATGGSFERGGFGRFLSGGG
jgi:hypothetical protein